jgi:NAD(P)-dependent dehydrogenase (short-subunit alcohol dehydrogenase family)
MSTQKVWFITGASKGLGLSLVKQLLKGGYPVAATSRNVRELSDAVGVDERFLPLAVDLTKEDSVADGISKAVERFGRIDVVVNNAGYGIGGSVEELTDEETRASFDVNLFGTVNVIRKAMPYLRAQGSGHIINISSIGGINASSGWALYSAAKFAVVGLSEALATDVAEFGVKVTVVAPGAFRTSFLTDESLTIAKHPLDAYTAVRATHKRFKAMDGTQAGDPEKAAAAMIRIAQEENPPLYLLLGQDAYDRAIRQVDELKRTFEANKELTVSTGF